MKNAAAGLSIAALPWLVGGVAAASAFPPLLAYLLFPGRWLLVTLGLIVFAWGVLDRIAIDPVDGVFRGIAEQPWFAFLALVFVAFVSFARVPQPEKEAEAFGGDEPKYLRIAFSLLRDSDADVAGGRTETPGLDVRVQQIRHLALATRDATVELFRPADVPPGHVWNAGNWTVRGLDGGLYHLQPPGLPALVAVALGIGEWLLPERDPGIYVAVLLALIWTLVAQQLWRLAIDIVGDRGWAFLFAGMILLSAPVYVGGYQLFPESLSLLLFPWLYRHLRGREEALSPLMALACGFVTGYLLWIHPKLTLVALFFLVMAIIRPVTSVGAKSLFVAAFAVVAFTSLLYCHHISGLFRPEGLYIRQAEEYVGSPNPFSLRFVAGLVKGLLGARDGLLVFAPILVLGAIATSARVWLTRASVELAGLFLLVWLTSAVHDGASLGSPARLMAPVAFIPALFLTRTLREDHRPALKAAALWLFVLGCGITVGMSSDWRKNVNPYRNMFAGVETNFEPSLPGNSFSDSAYVVDIEKGALIVLLALLSGAALARSPFDEPRNSTPALFGLSVVGLIVLLSVGLRWLTPS